MLGDDLQKLLPLIPPGQSDSACLDNMVELLAAAPVLHDLTGLPA
ncbi:hypothetical protein [Akkermansia sp.]